MLTVNYHINWDFFINYSHGRDYNNAMKKVLLNCPSGTIICTCQKTWKMACKQQAKINLLSTFDTRSATRLAIFERSWWKSLAKVAQIFVNFVSYFDKHIFFSINCCGFFLGNYCWNWGAFYSTIRSHWTRVTTYLCFIGFWFCALIYLLVDSHLFQHENFLLSLRIEPWVATMIRQGLFTYFVRGRKLYNWPLVLLALLPDLLESKPVKLKVSRTVIFPPIK